MDNSTRNPFTIVKANDFTDQEILDYWVDIPGDSGFHHLVDPLTPMPMIIMGGKGSGKTHLMRYFSYPLQKVKHPENILKGIEKDKFIGIYLKCGGLNSGRFTEKNIDEEIWKNFFPYYFDIWMAQLILDTVIEALSYNDNSIDEEKICTEILDCFDDTLSESPKTLLELSSTIKQIQKQLDMAVNNCIFTRSLDGVQILATPGKLFYGIPRVLSKNIKEFNDILFVYLIDELENLHEYQQVYIQSLMRDIKLPCSIKIGVRTYGMKTYKTMADNEENREGSEFSILRLDKKLREKNRATNYKQFAVDLGLSRLRESGKISDKITSQSEFFDYFEEEKTINELDNIPEISSGISGKTIAKLKSALNKHEQSNIKNGVSKPSQTTEIINLLSFEGMPLLEKAATYSFYKEWSKSKKLLESAISINTICNNFIADKDSQPQFKELISKFKSDLLAQLRKDNAKKDSYAGIETLIKISKGFPRSFLTLLKHIYQYSAFNGETPFHSKKISIKSQIEGVKQSSLWYFEDTRIAGKDGAQIKSSIEKLAELYRINRYSDKPSECSLTTFSGDLTKASKETQRIIGLASDWSMLLVDPDGRKDKNSSRVDSKFILNPMLSPHWGLPISVRGVINFNEKTLNAIFDPAHESDYKSIKSEFENSRNAPFNKSLDVPTDFIQGAFKL